MQWIDAGVNLTDKRLDYDSVVEDCNKANITHIVAIGTTLEESIASVNYAKQSPRVFATAGIHPHYAESTTTEQWRQLTELVHASEVVAVGECGLDYNRNFSTPASQRYWFEKQLQLACEVGKPVYLHERDAFNDQYQLLSKYVAQLSGGVVHCFTGHSEQMQAYLELGFHIGITGWLCDEKRGTDLRNSMTVLPLDRLILETDAPYLVAKTIRPRPRHSMPSHIPVIAEKVAELTGFSLTDIQAASHQNTLNLFKSKNP